MDKQQKELQTSGFPIEDGLHQLDEEIDVALKDVDKPFEDSSTLPLVDDDAEFQADESDPSDVVYAITASRWSTISARVLAFFWFLLLMMLCSSSVLFFRFASSFAILYWGALLLSIGALVLYARLLQLHIQHLEDFLCVAHKQIRGIAYPQWKDLVKNNRKELAFDWSDIERMFVESVEAPLGGKRLVLIGKDNKTLAQLDMSFLSFSKQELVTAVRENSGRNLFAGAL